MPPSSRVARLLTWDRHLPTDLEHHLSLCRGLSHGGYDVVMRSVDCRVAVDVGDLVSDLETTVHVCGPTRNYGADCRLT